MKPFAFCLALFLAMVPLLEAYASSALGPYKGQLILHHCGAATIFNEVPRFEDFPAEHATRKIAEYIDWASNKSAWVFRTRLRAGLKSGANFNGHYAVVQFGCGSPCQVQMIIDVETGKVLDRTGSTYGATYELNSSLFATDLPEDNANWSDYSLLRYGGPRFYQVKTGRLIHLKDIDVSAVNESGHFPCDEGQKKKRWAPPRSAP